MIEHDEVAFFAERVFVASSLGRVGPLRVECVSFVLSSRSTKKERQGSLALSRCITDCSLLLVNRAASTFGAIARRTKLREFLRPR
jgi:hypothetical protein